MSISIKYLLKDSTKKAIENQGLKVSLVHDRDYKGCRINANSVWVGVDVKPFRHINDVTTLDEMVKTYSSEVLGMPNTDDIIWFPVFKKLGARSEFSTTRFSEQRALNYAGFIYIEKSTITSQSKTDMTNNELFKAAQKQIDEELAEYAISCDYDPYLITVQSHNGLCEFSANWFNVDGDVDKKAYALIDKVSNAIKQMDTTYRVELDIIDIENPTPEKINDLIIVGFLKTFNTIPLIGETEYNKERGTATLYFPLESLPDIETLASTKGVRLISRINEEAGFFGADIYGVWTKNAPYSEWDAEDADAYIKGLFSFIPSMKCSYTTKHHHRKRR